MSWRVCSTPGCPNLIETPARKCDACARAQRDRARTRGHNPYGTKGHQSFRRQVLARDPYCTCPGDSGRGGCGKHHGLCGNPSTIADHYPQDQQASTPDNKQEHCASRQKQPATPQGGGVTTTPLGPPVSCLSGAQGSNIAGGPPRGRSRRSVARAQGHDER